MEVSRLRSRTGAITLFVYLTEAVSFLLSHNSAPRIANEPTTDATLLESFCNTPIPTIAIS